jgi:UDP-N-acetyl-D-glucosamine dehydrogenase
MVRVGVLGLGYAGQRLVQAVSGAGQQVVGYDVNAGVVARLNAGHSQVDDVSDADVDAMCAAGFVASADESVLAGTQVKVVCVPTPLTAGGEPDLTAVLAASRSAGRHLRRDELVVLESTSYPGTTDEVVRPALEHTSGLRAGTDFHLAFSPERIDPGNPMFGVQNTPKVVGGYLPCCATAASSFYRKVCAVVVEAKSTREAEMAKLLENAYRLVNIALSYELAIVCRSLNVDPWDAIACAATKPFGFQPFYPGPGIGGHCIPIDPIYLSHRARAEGEPFRLIELARDINAQMPSYVVQRATDLLARNGRTIDGAQVLLLGVAYKPNVSDLRETPAEPVARLLKEAGAEVSYHDPYVPHWAVDGTTVPFIADAYARIPTADLTVLLQDHGDYDFARIARDARLVLDTRGRTRHFETNGEAL